MTPLLFVLLPSHILLSAAGDALGSTPRGSARLGKLLLGNVLLGVDLIIEELWGQLPRVVRLYLSHQQP